MVCAGGGEGVGADGEEEPRLLKRQVAETAERSGRLAITLVPL